MSVIVYRDGVLAADMRGYVPYGRPVGKKVKTRHYPNGCLAGICSGAPGTNERVLSWLEWVFDAQPDVTQVDWEAQKRLDDLQPFVGLLVSAQGQAYMFDDRLFPSGPLSAPFWAIGSGADFALGALLFGASAVEAVRIAAMCDRNCGEAVFARKHDGHSWQSSLEPIAAPDRTYAP